MLRATAFAFHDRPSDGLLAVGGSITKPDLLGERLLLVRTEKIGTRAVQDKIFDFIGLRAPYFDEVLNRATTADGDGMRFRY